MRLTKVMSFQLIGLLFFVGSSLAQEVIPSSDQLLAIEKRGKEIEEYERAAIRATDLLLASKPDKSKLGRYIAVKQGDVWTVYFGKLTDKGFEFAYVYSCPNGKFDQMKYEADPQTFSKDVFWLAKADSVAREATEPDRKVSNYNTDVFRENDGSFTVYLTPGNTNANSILLGGDFKVTISNDASKVIQKENLHKTIIELPLLEKDKKPAGAYHSHIISDLPTETDVALILLNPALAPHFISGKIWMSKIDADGKITVLGKTAEVLGKQGAK